MTTLAEWFNVLLFPVGTLVLVSVVWFVERRAAARWRAEKEAKRLRYNPLEE